MAKVIIIGAGASGIIAALTASRKHEVLLFDSNDKIGKKILITGNGRCNYWNDEIEVSKYNTDNESVLKSILDNKDDTLKYLDNLGIYPKKINGYYYPNNNMAASIRLVFERAILKSNIELHLNEEVKGIEKGEKFNIITSKNSYTCDKVIIATGSKAYPKMGTTGIGYELLDSLGLDINPVLPALTKLISNDQITNKWDGVRLDGKITISLDGSELISDIGELQLIKNGISGIPTFNVSSVASKHIGSKVIAKLDFLKDVEDLANFIKNNNQENTIEETFETLLNYKLTYAILDKIHLNPKTKLKELKSEDISILVDNIKSFKLNIIDTDTYDASQVCTGGLSLNYINPLNMEVSTIPNLYVTGEILDVDGRCGGYNLGFAFITGYIVGTTL